MGEHLTMGGQRCREELLFIPAGFIDELETLLANEGAGRVGERSRQAAAAFVGKAYECMAVDETPWPSQTVNAGAGMVGRPANLSSAGSLSFPKSGECAEVVYDPGYWGTAFGMAEAKLAVACANAVNAGRPLPKWGSGSVPRACETKTDGKSSPTLSTSWWSFKLFKPWASRWWLPPPHHDVHSLG